jgi:uncharacterized protein YndB with AHSA1/START domain
VFRLVEQLTKEITMTSKNARVSASASPLSLVLLALSVVAVALPADAGADDTALGDATPASVEEPTRFRHRSVVGWSHPGPARRLEWELVVPAPVGEVWRAWSTADGIATWAAPAGYVELHAGGAWEAHFAPDRPKGQRGSDANLIVEVVPEQILVIRAGAPVRFPTVRAEKTTFLVTLTPVGEGHTLVRATQSGWKEGAEWDEAFLYLADANAVWLDWLHQRFTTGPIDWSKGPAK